MQSMDGISAPAALRRVLPQSTVVPFNLHDDTATRAQASAAGVAAFVGKHDGVKVLLFLLRLLTFYNRREDISSPLGKLLKRRSDESSFY
jgi:DNA-binding NarL/FixJ family response regulator